jgi:hypothetical protein
MTWGIAVKHHSSFNICHQMLHVLVHRIIIRHQSTKIYKTVHIIQTGSTAPEENHVAPRINNMLQIYTVICNGYLQIGGLSLSQK